ncbi:efflux RND transporter periplasmic adaptor subunit [Actinomyces urogenitalis]|uniref:efflux RND transporter periplasmic adaptor subunit n=1 Tax=Actinomyces urogenitalis TaxID=103621 RepID=UPI00254B961A|nr:efflux RND transporter periplasmic adaptor subunit [Actinomyces urogenitalis]MDK8836130.1 efflux RND transporter periplasmic adaptor subunit [Actinomyces urogenitalis]
MRRYVLPTLKILLVLVIAVALTKIAFFPSQEDGTAAGPSPDFSVGAQTTTATTGDISNTIDIKGQIVEDAALEAQATLEGVIEGFSVEKGATVTQGAPLLTIKKTEPQEPLVYEEKDENGELIGTREVPQPDKVTRAVVYAPATGVVSFNVIQDQQTSVGTVVATVAPGTFSATGTITPSQLYQLTDAPATAQLTLEGGPAPFECQGLRIGTKATTSTTTNPTSGDVTTTTGDGTTVEVRCAVPAEQKVFPGLPVTIGVDAGSASGVLLVPVTAVEGSTSKGNVWVVTDPDNPQQAEKREVTLGINDGLNIEVTEGLTEGEEILLFVPGKDAARTGEPNSCDDYACYDENGQEYL